MCVGVAIRGIVTPASLAIPVKTAASLQFQHKTKFINYKRSLIAMNSSAFSTYPGLNQVLGILWLFHNQLPRRVFVEKHSQQKVVSAAQTQIVC